MLLLQAVYPLPPVPQHYAIDVALCNSYAHHLAWTTLFLGILIGMFLVGVAIMIFDRPKQDPPKQDPPWNKGTTHYGCVWWD